MASPMTADSVLDRYFLDMRSKLLELAADLDRIEFADESERVAADARLAKLRDAIGVLTDQQSDRAARVQMIFSDAYETGWVRPSASR
jgi:hypothetical protein